MKKLLTLFFNLILVHCSIANNFLYSRFSIFEYNAIKYNFHEYSEGTPLPGNEKNIEEWQTKYPSVKNLDAFHELVYRNLYETIDSLIKVIEGNIKPFSTNEFAKLLIQNKDKETLLYLLFAKKCEPLVVQVSLHNDKVKVGYDKSDLQAEGRKLLSGTKNIFLRQRYAFQLVRLSYYHQTPQKTIDLFDEIANNKLYEKNYIYYRTLLHKAFALKKNNQFEKALPLFAEVFAYVPVLRGMVVFNTLYINDSESYYPSDYIISQELWERTVENTTDKAVKNALYKLYFLYLEDINGKYLEGLFSNGEDLEVLELIFAKQLKIAEKQYFIPNVTQEIELDSTKLTYGYDAPISTPKKAIIRKKEEPKGFFVTLLEQFFKWLKEWVAGKKRYVRKTPKIDTRDLSENKDIIALEEIAAKIAQTKENSIIFYLGTAYLQLMRKKYDLAKINLAKAKSIATKDKIQTSQILYFETLLLVTETDSITPNIENIVVNNTQLLWKDSLDNDNWQKTLLFSELGRKYLAHHDLAKAVLCFRHIDKKQIEKVLLDFYATLEDLENYLSFIKGKANTPIKKLFWYLLPEKEEDKINFVRDLQATKLAREGKFKESLKTFKTISSTYWGIEVEKQNPNNTEEEDSTKKIFTVFIDGKEVVLNADDDQDYEENCKKITTSYGSSFTEEDTFQTFKNKMLLIEKLVELEAIAKTKQGNEAAKIYFTMANAMYHTPYWLYNNAIWQCDGMMYAIGNFEPPTYPFNVSTEVATNAHNRKKYLALVYCMPYLANLYYKKGFDVAQSQDIKATALLGQYFSWKKRLASHWENGIKTDYRPYKILKEQYPNSPQTQKIIKQEKEELQ